MWKGCGHIEEPGRGTIKGCVCSGRWVWLPPSLPASPCLGGGAQLTERRTTGTLEHWGKRGTHLELLPSRTVDRMLGLVLLPHARCLAPGIPEKAPAVCALAAFSVGGQLSVSSKSVCCVHSATRDRGYIGGFCHRHFMECVCRET